jgi:hypothetical protein
MSTLRIASSCFSRPLVSFRFVEMQPAISLLLVITLINRLEQSFWPPSRTTSEKTATFDEQPGPHVPSRPKGAAVLDAFDATSQSDPHGPDRKACFARDEDLTVLMIR